MIAEMFDLSDPERSEASLLHDRVEGHQGFLIANYLAS